MLSLQKAWPKQLKRTNSMDTSGTLEYGIEKVGKLQAELCDTSTQHTKVITTTCHAAGYNI